MPRKQSKKQLILDLFRQKGIDLAGERTLQGIQADLRRALGPDDGTSLSYIASVLREAGTPVNYQDRFTDLTVEEPYASRLAGQLQFHDLAAAEQSLRSLDGIYRAYREVSDREGTSLVRALVRRGKQRAESIAANPRVGAEKRQEKQEIARWFHVWLETSDLFFDWLEIRKESEDFRRLFPTNHHDGGGNLAG